MKVWVLVTLSVLAVTPTEGQKSLSRRWRWDAWETPRQTEFCRNNPRSLSCKLAREDPARAKRLFRENQWAFLKKQTKVSEGDHGQIFSDHHASGTGAWLTQNPSWVVRSSPAPVNHHPATDAFDGDTGTLWNPHAGGWNHNNWYIVLDLKVPTTLTRIALNNYGDNTHDIAAFKLQKWSLNTWEDVVSVTYVLGRTRKRQEFGGFQGTARHWRFVVTRTHSGWQPWLSELNLYGMSPATLSVPFPLKSEGRVWPFPQKSEDPAFCRIKRHTQKLRLPQWMNMEPFSLQVGQSKHQEYTHVECADIQPVDCPGVCLTKKSNLLFLAIYSEYGELKVSPELVEVPTACELEMLQ